jgi:hypothetical protein
MKNTSLVKGLKSNESLFDGYTGTGHRESGPGIDEEDGEAVSGFGLLQFPPLELYMIGLLYRMPRSPTVQHQPNSGTTADKALPTRS